MNHILIVDDNKSNLISAKNVLNNEYKVTAVTSGIQALKFLEGHTADMVLLDINMPEMDGFEVMANIRKLPNGGEIPIIFLTADNEAETESRCLEEGAIDFIAKPFVPSVMLSRIGRILELEELRRSLACKLDEKIREVTDMKSKSCQDALTGLWNRAYTEEIVNQMLADGAVGSLFMIDMDNFKAINDNYGHIAGDHTLKMFAETLMKFSSEGDVVCRIGGDEFVVFVAGETSKSAIGNHASDIISDMCFKLEECKFETNSSVSIGISQFPEDGANFNALYNAADKALYYVKQNGKNSYHFFSEQSAEQNKRASKNVDLNYLRQIMKRTDSGCGAYLLDFDSFHHVYNFIRRIVERSKRDVQTVLFTLSEKGGSTPDPIVFDTIVEILDQAIYTSLRRVDVSTRYSSKQVIVILMDANAQNSELVAQRIIECFNKLYTGNDVSIDYDIVQMSEGGNITKSINAMQG